MTEGKKYIIELEVFPMEGDPDPYMAIWEALDLLGIDSIYTIKEEQDV